KCRGNTARMAPSSTSENCFPIHLTRFNSADGRVGPVIENRACPRRSAKLNKVEPKPTIIHPQKIGSIHACLPHAILHQARETVLGKTGNPGTLESQTGNSYRHIQ